MENSKEKQIEEMARIIANANGNEQDAAYYRPDATDLYNAGYRKATDVAEEIFAEIEPILLDYQNNFIRGLQLITFIKELKKKYKEEGK